MDLKTIYTTRGWCILYGSEGDSDTSCNSNNGAATVTNIHDGTEESEDQEEENDEEEEEEEEEDEES
jgi:hypothetical protein